MVYCDKMSRKPRWEKKGYEHIGQAIDNPKFEFESWSDELVKELYHRFKNGADTEKLAQQTGLTEYSIREKLNLKHKEKSLSL